MNKKYLKNIIGLTLIEILIGIVITSIMMAAMYTSYNVVNQSYSKVSEKAKISKSSRDLVSMLMRDIRMAGFRYYAGTYEIEQYRTDSIDQGCAAPGMTLPKVSYLAFDNGFISQQNSHNPIVIRKNNRFADDGTLTIGADGECCDLIEIVYEDFNQNNISQPFKKYRITYFGKQTGTDTYTSENGTEITINKYGVYKKIESWDQARGLRSCDEFPPQGNWVGNGLACPECTNEPILIRDHIDDMEFIPFDENGKVIKNSSGQFPAPELSDIRDQLYDIRGVDVRLTLRSKEQFYRKELSRVISGLSNTDATNTDKYLRDSVIVSVNTRNLGGQSF
jgi:hypothetical protein